MKVIDNVTDIFSSQLGVPYGVDNEGNIFTWDANANKTILGNTNGKEIIGSTSNREAFVLIFDDGSPNHLSSNMEEMILL